MPDDCLNPYSVTKTCGEKLCKIYTRLFDLETVVFRYFNVYGERQPLKGQYAPVIGIFIRQKNNNEKMTIVGDGKQRRDFTHVSDVVQANILASDLQNKEAVGETFNIGTGKNHSILEIVNFIKGDYTFVSPRPAEARETKANNTKARNILGWLPTISVKDWIKNNS
jgi:UDP-glucose 4-epimerase